MNEHTIVVRYDEAAEPSYSVATEFLGGQVVAVDFDGNRLAVEQELIEALDQAVTSMLDSGYSKSSAVVRAAIQALEKAKKSHRGAA